MANKAGSTFFKDVRAVSTDVHRSPASSHSMLTKSMRGSFATPSKDDSFSFIFLFELRSPGEEVDSCCQSSSTGPNYSNNHLISYSDQWA